MIHSVGECPTRTVAEKIRLDPRRKNRQIRKDSNSYFVSTIVVTLG